MVIALLFIDKCTFDRIASAFPDYVLMLSVRL